MIIEYQFSNDTEREKILNDNIDKFQIGEKFTLNGDFLIFSDVPTIEVLQKKQGDKITNLEAGNKALKEELTITQDAINELILLSMSL